MQEAHRQKHQVALNFELTVGNLLEGSASGNRIFQPFQPHSLNAADTSFVVRQKFFGGDRIVTFAAFFLGSRRTKNV